MRLNTQKHAYFDYQFQGNFSINRMGVSFILNPAASTLDSCTLKMVLFKRYDLWRSASTNTINKHTSKGLSFSEAVFLPNYGFHASNDNHTTKTEKTQQKQNKCGLSVYHAIKPVHEEYLSASGYPTSVAHSVNIGDTLRIKQE